MTLNEELDWKRGSLDYWKGIETTLKKILQDQEMEVEKTKDTLTSCQGTISKLEKELKRLIP